MSGSTSVMAAGEGFRQPFTAVQWQELEHQALIYKYLAAGMPVPVDLVIPIRMSLEALSARFFHHPTFGYCSYYGKKFDPEPGRCRRTDGKKWRCSKDAHPDSKYCERHMHRGRNRSRKPVESQTTSSLSSSSTTRTINGGGGTTKYQQTAGTFQNLPLFSMVNSDSLEFGRNISKSDVSTVSFGISNGTDNRYINGVTPDDDEKTICSDASGIERKESGTWKLRTPQTESSTNHSQHPLHGNMHQLYKATTTVDSPMTPHQQQQNMMRSFFDEWPNKAKDSWSDLSMSMPMHSHAEFPPHDA